MAEVDKKGKKYYILLHGKCAAKRDKGITASSRLEKDKFVTLLKGEILTEACEREQPKEKTLIRLNPIEKLTVSLECPVTDVQRIDEDEANLLLGLSSLSERLRVFEEQDTLRIAKEMVVGSRVWVTVAVHGLKNEGVIKYKGPLPGSPGTMFGVELLGSVGKGSTNGSFKGQHYFHCDKDAGVFVSLEKLKPRNIGFRKDSKDNKPETAIKDGTGNLHEANKGKTKNRGSLSSSTLSKQSSEEFVDGDIEHKIQDAVWVFIGVKLRRGIVKYIGRPPGEKQIIVGIQMDTDCGEGDGEYYGKQLFTCLKKYAHFTPIENVISKEKFRQMYKAPEDAQVSKQPSKSTRPPSDDDIVQMESNFTKQSKKDVIKEQEEIFRKAKAQAQTNIENKGNIGKHKEGDKGGGDKAKSDHYGGNNIDNYDSWHVVDDNPGKNYSTGSTNGRSKERLSLFNVKSSVYNGICAQLNTPVPNKDYKALAERMGYTSEEIQRLQQRENPADALLFNWAYKNENDVNKLIELLRRMGRSDVVEILETHGGSKERSIFNVSSSAYRDICARLNLPVLNKDWKAVAGHLGYSSYEIKTLEQRENPASALLNNWATNSENDVNKLIEVLKRMERYDIVEILELEEQPSDDDIVQMESNFTKQSKKDVIKEQEELFRKAKAQAQTKIENKGNIGKHKEGDKGGGDKAKSDNYGGNNIDNYDSWGLVGDNSGENDSTGSTNEQPSDDDIVQMESNFTKQSKKDVIKEQEELFRKAKAQAQTKIENKGNIGKHKEGDKGGGDKAKSDNYGGNNIDNYDSWGLVGDNSGENDSTGSTNEQPSDDDIVQMESNFTKQSKKDVIKEQEELFRKAKAQAQTKIENKGNIGKHKEGDKGGGDKAKSDNYGGNNIDNYDSWGLVGDNSGENDSTGSTNGNSTCSCSKKSLPALAAAPVAQMESLLTCSICLETLQDPRTLGCFHSFCKSCLEKFVKRQREMARAEAAAKGKDVNLEEFNCPMCRFSFCLKQDQEVEGMTPNHFVGNMLEVLAIQRQTKDIPCSLCEGPAVSRCTTCNEFLCSKCLIAHENWLKFKDHVVLTMDELASPENQGKARGTSHCQTHENKSLKFYCETCQELVCRYCMDFNHAKENHSCLLAKDVVEKEREAIRLCCGILEENLEEGNQALQKISNVVQSLENNAKKAKEDIIQQKETIIKTFTQKLEEKAHLMMNEVDEKCKEILIPIEKQKSEIQAYVEKMKGSVDLSKVVLDKGNNEEILSSKKMIEENVGRMKKECPKKMKPVHDGVIQFKAKPINYAMIIDKLGEIACTRIAPDSNLWNTSTILKDEPEYIGQMDEWMNNQFQWRLCYRASSDGWQGEDFHRCCDSKGPTVTVVKVEDYIFGGYTDQNWEGLDYRQSTSSFLFSLRNNDKVPPFKAPVYQLSEHAMLCNPNYGPIFGDGHDLLISDNAHGNRGSYTQFGATYKPPAGYSYGTEQTKSLLAGSYLFSPTEIEVFY